MGGQSTQLLFIVGMIAVFYWLVLRPQQKRAKAQRDMLDALTVGDEIVTIGGIYATVVATGERLRVRLLDGTELELAMQAVGRVIPADEAEDEADEGDEPAEADEADEAADEPALTESTDE